MRISKKLIREIRITSVYEEVLRSRFESNNGMFTDHAPDTWSDDQRDAFDMVTELEEKLKAAILKVLGADNDQAKANHES